MNATPEELAAVIAALHALTPPEPDRVQTQSPWKAAARREALYHSELVEGRPSTSRASKRHVL